MADELILVEKDGEQIRVHPGTLENHKLLGWKVVEAVSAETLTAPADVVEEVEQEKPAPEPKGEKPKGRGKK